MNKELELQSRNGVKVINLQELFVISEVGNQFNGDYETAIRLAKATKDAGADAVKYIFWFPDEIMAEDRPYTYLTNEGEKTESMFDLLNRLRLTIEEWHEVKQYCDKIDILMLSTVNCPSAMDWAEELSLPAIKLSSWDWNFTDLWSWAAKMALPCIADLGAVTETEFGKNIKLFKDNLNGELMFLQCFHTDKPEQINMLNIPYLARKYDCLMGYSAAGRDDSLDALSIGLGACVLEKRLTLSRKGGILHDTVSKEPGELKEYVTAMRRLKQSLGSEKISFSNNDWAERKKWFRRVVADCNIAKGDFIWRQDLECKRGETGLAPDKIWDLVGKTAKRDIKRNEDIREEDVSDN